MGSSRRKRARNTPQSSRDFDFERAVIAYEQKIRIYAKPRSQKAIAYNCSRFLTFFREHGFSRESVDRYVQERLADVAPSTVKQDLTILKAILHHAIELGMVETLPFRLPRIKANQKRVLRTLSAEDIQHLLDCAYEPYRTLILLQSACGAQVSEMLHLTWEDIVWSEGRLIIQPKDGWSPKNHQARSCWLKPAVIEHLRVFQEESGLSEGWVFRNQKGGRLSEFTTSCNLRKIFEAAGLYRPGITSHLLRHSVATTLLRNGVDLMTVKDFLGHKDANTTLRYLHADDQRVKEAVDKLPW